MGALAVAAHSRALPSAELPLSLTPLGFPGPSLGLGDSRAFPPHLICSELPQRPPRCQLTSLSLDELRQTEVFWKNASKLPLD